MAEAQPDDVVTLVYTSGTTGPPKGAMLTNANVEFVVGSLVRQPERLPDNRAPGPDDLVVTYLPLCHVAERIFSTWHMVGAGVVLNFAESIETVTANLREVQPTLFFAVPRIWEKLHAGVLIKGNDASRTKRFVFRRGMKAAAKIGRAKVAHGGNHTASSRMRYAFWYPVLFRPLQERIGLRRCRHASSGAAPIAPEVLEFFMGIGVPIFELYGMTENSALGSLNMPGNVKVGTVGVPYPGTEVRLDPDTNEIQTRHPGSFAGYWGKPDKTAETFTADGFLCTGDVGEWVDGTHLRIVDRIKHIIITSGGKNVSPSEIENVLKTSPYVKEAMVIGDGRKYLTALIGIEYDTVGNWALRRNLPYTTYRDLSEKPEVIELIQGVVNETNNEVRLRRAGQEVPPDAQGARSRGRRADGHPEDQARSDRQGVQRPHRVDVCLTDALDWPVRPLSVRRPDRHGRGGLDSACRSRGMTSIGSPKLTRHWWGRARTLRLHAGPRARPGVDLRPRRPRLRARVQGDASGQLRPRCDRSRHRLVLLARAHRLGDPRPMDRRQPLRRVVPVVGRSPSSSPCCSDSSSSG